MMSTFFFSVTIAILGWHTYRCTPPLAEVPEGHFLCERCRAEGVTLESIDEQRQVAELHQLRPPGPDLFPAAEKRRRDERAAALHGRLVQKHLGDRVLWGVVQFKGPLERPKYFKVSYSDGSEEDGLTHRLVTTGRGYRLQAVGVQPPAGVRLPEVRPLRPGGVPW
ncbi:MAG UNVERIFIED_CONTAM: hypothetical protein LVR18_25190 [Planctomycetaceae bacterium]|jgi:hypothetical protein